MNYSGTFCQPETSLNAHEIILYLNYNGGSVADTSEIFNKSYFKKLCATLDRLSCQPYRCVLDTFSETFIAEQQV